MVLIAVEVDGMNCRICLRKCQEDDIFISGGISARYKLLTGFDMKLDDFLKRICANCSKDLKHLALFRDKCSDTERKLKQLKNTVTKAHKQSMKGERSIVLKEDASRKFKSEPECIVDNDEPLVDQMNEIPETMNDDDSSDYGIEPLEMGPMVEQPVEKEQKTGKGKRSWYRPGSAICDICGFHYKNKYALHRHRERHTRKPDDPKFGCHLCLTSNEDQDRQRKAWYPTKVALKGHLRLYHQKKHDLPCTICGLMFKTKFTLTFHHYSKHVDPKEYPLECTICHKRFFKQCVLDKHALYHGERTFPCEFCNAMFYSAHNVKTHIKTVHSTGEYKCKFCDKIFNSMQYLYQHMKQHKQSYACPICPRLTFGTCVLLKAHLQEYHPQLPLPPSRTKLHNHDWSVQLQQMMDGSAY